MELPLSSSASLTCFGVNGIELWSSLCLLRIWRMRALDVGFCLWGVGPLNCVTKLVATSRLSDRFLPEKVMADWERRKTFSLRGVEAVSRPSWDGI